MGKEIPASKAGRCLTGGKAAVRVGGEVVQYLSRKPFMRPEERRAARESLDHKNAQVVFDCLSMLKGTALKAAQMLSLEMDILPEVMREELQKSYNQVPPLNRALARKAVRTSLGQPPEKAYRSFDTAAFAAASLGQVHRAESPDGIKLAVKLQYPGIQNTIKSDLQLLRAVFKSMQNYKYIAPALNEVEARLIEEIDYQQEARNLDFFARNLKLDNFIIPKLWQPGCGTTILSETFVEGLPLNHWLKTNPQQAQRDDVARQLNDLFLYCLYELKCIHADPNPGNFIIRADGSIGLVDFGCVKHFEPRFVGLYRQMPLTMVRGDQGQYFEILRALGFTDSGLDKGIERDIYQTAYGFGKWLSQLYETDRFDFSKHPDFIARGKEHMHAMYRHRRHIALNPEIIFLNRTRYGLLRLFERLGARLNLRNRYEMAG